MKRFIELLSEAMKKGNGLEIHIGGDRYDGGVVVNVFFKGKKVHDQVMDGEEDFTFGNKKFSDYNKFAKAVGDKYKMKPKRVEMK